MVTPPAARHDGGMETTTPSIARLAAATPATRERYADFLRAFSIIVVVIGHWLMAAVTFSDGTFDGRNALEVLPGLHHLTWVFQVMPLFFFVGGFANARALEAGARRGDGVAAFYASRVRRLAGPTARFALVGLGVASVVGVVMGADLAATVGLLLAMPLWFLATYIVVIMAAPIAHRAHRRRPVLTLGALIAAAVAVDGVSRGVGVSIVGPLNFLFVWLVPHQLGYVYADGRLPRAGRWIHVLLAATGLAGLVLLTWLGPYQTSMIGLGAGSNVSPPSVVLIALTVWQVGLVMLARPSIARWLERPGPWMATIAVNARIMTVFLWHQTALLLGAMVLLPLGFPQHEIGSSAWWLARIGWVVALAVILVPIIAVAGGAERPGRGGGPSLARAVLACVVLSASMVTLTQVGFGPGVPTVAAFGVLPAAAVAGVALSARLGRG